ncbi:MAG: ATP-binding protein [Candidatus Acidiferrales bacterium]
MRAQRNPQIPQACTGGRLAQDGWREYAWHMAQADCPKCNGTGWKIVEGEREIQPAEQGVPAAVAKQAEADGVKAFAVSPSNGSKHNASAGLPRMAVPCECTFADKRSRMLERARLPKRYQHCNFESYDTDQYDRETHGGDATGWSRSLAQAKLVVQGFARDFPIATEHGLMLMGPCGVGKTHLAVAALEEIILRGHSGLFYDYRELLKQIQDSYNPDSNSTEMGVLEPVLKTEVLLLDDLGSSKPSLWALETVGHILNTRYNEHRVTVLTTNFLDTPPGPLPRIAGGRAVQTEDTLTDRVGARIRSRLYEMCRTVEICAPDYRKEIRQAGHFNA